MKMSGPKKAGLECPICHSVFSPVELPIHVNEHFDDESIIKCEFPGCSASIDESQLNDHMLAHQMCEENVDYELNVVALACITQEDHDIPGPSTDNNSDEVLARRLQLEDNKKLEEESYKDLQEEYGMTDKKIGYAKQFEKEMGKRVGGKFSVGEYYEMKSNIHNSLMSGYDSDNTRTPGIIKRLKSSLNLGNGSASYFSIETDHFAVDIGDKGWGCGYRNTQMLLSSLLNDPCYHEHLSIFNNRIPSVPKLQLLIENSWKDGYDTAGCQQLGGLLQGTRKWIGTTEVAAILSWLKIRTKLIDFHKPTGEGREHPQLFNWVNEYFKSRNNDGNAVPPFPLYMQHQGHSRLCIGCEEVNIQSDFPIKLLMFDPGFSKAKMESLLKSKDFNNHSKCLKKSTKQMKHAQFQLLYVDGIISNDAEIEASKIIRSIRIPP